MPGAPVVYRLRRGTYLKKKYRPMIYSTWYFFLLVQSIDNPPKSNHIFIFFYYKCFSFTYIHFIIKMDYYCRIISRHYHFVFKVYFSFYVLCLKITLCAITFKNRRFSPPLFFSFQI